MHAYVIPGKTDTKHSTLRNTLYFQKYLKIKRKISFEPQAKNTYKENYIGIRLRQEYFTLCLELKK